MNRTANPHVSISTQAEIYKHNNPFPHMQGRNVIGSKTLPKPGTPSFERLKARNVALAEPRNDPRFTKVSTMHPRRAAVFTGSVSEFSKKNRKK